MSIVIFAGPSVPANVLVREVEAEVRPPAARGDVLRAALAKPAAIALIDGYFDRMPSVWHKEILWAMAQGIHVFGAASMGALRAAELAAFGMQGVGAIFEAFRDGVLTDDDDVCVAHDQAQAGFRPLSEALVNVRATLAQAQAQSIIGADTRSELERLAKSMYYPGRSYPALLRDAERIGLPRGEIAALQQFLPAGRVDQKLLDALELARTLRAHSLEGFRPKTVSFEFARTDAWEALEREVRAGCGDYQAFEFSEDLKDELIADGTHGRTFDAALARLLSLKLAQKLGVGMDARAIEAVVEDFRRERRLLEPEQFQAWIDEQVLRESEIVDHFTGEAELRRVRAAFQREVHAALVEELRASARFGKLVRRAQEKRQVLSARGELDPGSPARIAEQELWRWYFERRLRRDPPSDLADYARDERIDLDRLRSAALKDWCYERALERDEARARRSS